MTPNTSSNKLISDFIFLITICLQVIVFCYSCSPKMDAGAGLAAKAESPLVLGYTFRAMPGTRLNDDKTSVYGLLGYSQFKFKNGGGHTNFLQVGVQLRTSRKKESENGPWVGGELAYLHITNKIDNSSTDPHASGFTLGGLAGYCFHLGKVAADIYLAPSFLHRGGFNTTGQTNSSPSSGFYGNLGFDVDPYVFVE